MATCRTRVVGAQACCFEGVAVSLMQFAVVLQGKPMSPLCIICNHGFSAINFVHVRSIGGKQQRVAQGVCGGVGLLF